MDLSSSFFWSNFAVLPFWVLMILAPRWRWTQRLVASPLIALLPALLYATLVLPRFVPIFGTVGTLSLEVIMPLLGTPEGATVAWLHFLAIDLLVGRWVYFDGIERNVTPWLLSPILFMVLMLAPIGFLVYLVVRMSSGLRSSALGSPTRHA